uniref:Uncharacterized protein n=1 Tax=Strix occidentalis caurina TaxID=311401 RepID=A0A8D0F1I3_STROC
GFSHQKPRLLARQQHRSLPIPWWIRVSTASKVPNSDTQLGVAELGWGQLEQTQPK